MYAEINSNFLTQWHREGKKGFVDQGGPTKECLGPVKEAGNAQGERNGIRGDLISDKIERYGQVVAVNSGPKRGWNLYFVTPKHVCIPKGRGMQQPRPRGV